MSRSTKPPGAGSTCRSATKSISGSRTNKRRGSDRSSGARAALWRTKKVSSMISLTIISGFSTGREKKPTNSISGLLPSRFRDKKKRTSVLLFLSFVLGFLKSDFFFCHWFFHFL
uniref:Uncharacterized protein n=1 Tax=uncultured marine virus TaxID=186617 RepID=A0A0F7L0W8_9VIRU|nr:hypothetical protein [uncultured marine virus]